MRNKRIEKCVTDIIIPFAIAFAAVMLICNFFFYPVSVEGESMFPTLRNNDKLIIEKITYYFKNPERGDIVVIKYPADISQRFIKRIAAVAGDKVKIENNILYINDKPQDEPYLLENTMQDFNEVTVPENTIFVLGDNRNNSVDSRSPDVGFVNKKLILGKAVLRLLPLKYWGRIR